MQKGQRHMEKQQKQSKIKKFCRQHAPMFRKIVVLVLPFLCMDVFMCWNAGKIQYLRTEMVFPNLLFQAAWIGLFVGITCNLGKKAAKIWYGMVSGLFFVLFLVHSIYYSLTGYFFGFHLLFMAGEGSAYILDTIVNTSPLIWLMCLVLLPLIFLAVKNIPQRERTNKKGILAVLAVFFALHAVTPLFLGKANTDLE